ncbi:MAG: protoheme IX farnesyltransferase [Planctomycetota bacterium]
MSSDLLTAEPPSDLAAYEGGAISGAVNLPGSGGDALVHEPTSRVVSVDTSVSTMLRDFVELTKPRILTMILVTTGATALVGAAGWVPMADMLLLLLGTGLVAGSAGAANQIWERVIDTRMPRTAVRPLPSGRMSVATATWFMGSIGTLGTAVLWLGFGATPALVGLATWMSYVFLYTPMKTRTSWNTTVGAVAGALPMLIGYTATGGMLTDGVAWMLFGVLAAWQYPHFMAIAWLYRQQYAEAGFEMSTTVEPTGRSAAAQSIAGSLAVIGCGVGLCFISPGVVVGSVAAVAVVLATVPMLRASVAFARDRNDGTARRMLRSSLLVLPAVLAVVTLRVFW